jgi:WD40 repeat protein
MEASLKEHRGRVADVRINKSDSQAVSASYDGSCIIWDIKNHTRVMCLFESTMFKQIIYHPDESQLLTTGSNRKVTYWDCFDGQAIRMLDGSDSGEINALAISRGGDAFVSGGEDKKIKVWDYDEGISYYSGVGHSGAIAKIEISPDQKHIVSVGSEGAIFIWQAPEKIANK